MPRPDTFTVILVASWSNPGTDAMSSMRKGCPQAFPVGVYRIEQAVEFFPAPCFCDLPGYVGEGHYYMPRRAGGLVYAEK